MPCARSGDQHLVSANVRIIALRFYHHDDLTHHSVAGLVICLGPQVFVLAGLILSQIASKRCYYLLLGESNDLRANLSIDKIGMWCFESTVAGAGRISYSGIDFDTKFNSAQAFSIVTTVFGSLCLAYWTLIPCCPHLGSPRNVLLCGAALLLTCFFEGMSLIMLQSTTFCKGNESLELGCELAKGAKCGIAACVCWFVASVLTCGMMKPAEKNANEAREGGGGGDNA